MGIQTPAILKIHVDSWYGTPIFLVPEAIVLPDVVLGAASDFAFRELGTQRRNGKRGGWR